MNLAEPEDAERVAAAISTASNHIVRELAMQCAGTILESSTSQPALYEAIRHVIEDPHASGKDRGDALQLLALADPEGAVALAVDLIGHPSLRVQANAAWLLVEHDPDRYAKLVADVVSRWPENAPYPAFEVRQLLDD
jgi:hypothetical protein